LLGMGMRRMWLYLFRQGQKLARLETAGHQEIGNT
jgi:hypothetical protein